MNGVSEGCRDVKINTSNRTQSKQNLEDTFNQGNFWRLDAGINVETVGSIFFHLLDFKTSAHLTATV